MKAIILAGGKGTRLASITDNQIPKPMVKISGKPILEYQINSLKENGIIDIIIIGGYLFECIKSYFRDGSSWGVNIDYIDEEVPLGTAGGLYYLKGKVKEDFILLFGDLLLNIDFERFHNFHRAKNALATIFVHPNSHPRDSDLIQVDDMDKITGFISKNAIRNGDYHNLVSAGVYCISPEMFHEIVSMEKLDLEKDILFSNVLVQKRLFAYHSTEYVKDLGTPDRFASGKNDLVKGLVVKKNLRTRQKAIFLDRDGTIIKYKPLLICPDEVELEDSLCYSVGQINGSEYLSFVITNQPVVARNLCTEDDVKKVHRRIETQLGAAGAYLDGFEFCPHHPDYGYPGENKAYKVNCTCRKPQIGLISKLAAQYNIDLKQSWFIGDTTVDVQTGKNAGMRTILLLTGVAGEDKKYDTVPDYVCKDLRSAVSLCLEEDG